MRFLSKNVYQIGILADTHNDWNPRIADIFTDVQEIWHLGDVCREEVVDECYALTDRVVIVLGNNDFGLNYPIARDLEREGQRFFLTHILPSQVPTGFDWVLYGHTHQPWDAVENGLHFFNPGCAGSATRGAPSSVGLLTSQEGRPFEAEIVPL